MSKTLNWEVNIYFCFVSKLLLWEAWQLFKYWLVLEEAPEAEGHQLEDGLQDKDEGEDVVTDLQSLGQLLGMSGRHMLKIDGLHKYPFYLTRQ